MNRLLCIGGLLLAAGVVRGEPPLGTKVIHVELHPAPAPSPALRYPLLPEVRDQKPGNAVPHYRDAIKTVKDAIKSLDDPRWDDRVNRWFEMPLDKLPRQRMRDFFRPLNPGLEMVRSASRHEIVDWELTEKLRVQGIGTLLPDVQEMRQFGTLLYLRARLAMADGRLDDAHRDLQTILTVGHQTAHAVLICDLVGIAIASVGLGQVDQFIQLPNAPNLYWALTDLPQPFVDVRLALQGERIAAYATFGEFPLLPGDAGKEMTPKQVERALMVAESLQRDDLVPRPVFRMYVALDLQHKHERAKQALIETGWPREAIEKMPHVQVGLLHGFLDYNRYLDEVSKYCNFPYPQAAPAVARVEKKGRGFHGIASPEQPAIAIADLLGPVIGRVLFARTRMERKIAALRCLEALRLYAASHDGKLPASLNDVKEVPIPVDPLTGKPFEYEATGNRASLYGIAVTMPNRKPLPQDALYYEIVMKR